MPPAPDNVQPLPSHSERIAARALKAMETHYMNRAQAIPAVIEYGQALLDAKKLFNNAKTPYGRWLVANGLDQGNPWSSIKERSEAMQVATIVEELRGQPGPTFENCKNARPSDIMSWYRKQQKHSARANKPVMQRLPDAAVEERDISPEHFTPAGRVRLEDAIRIHRRRLEKEFQHRVDTAVREGIARADQATRDQLKQVNAQLFNLRQLGTRGMFTLAEYNTILKCLHPDTKPTSEQKAAAFHLLNINKGRMIRA